MIPRLRRPALVGAAAVLALLAAVWLAAGLRPSASPSLLADPGAPRVRETPAQERAFGGEPIIVTATGSLASATLTGPNVLKLLDLEGRAARLPGVKAVYGPATFLNSALVQFETIVKRELGAPAERADRAARRAAAAAKRRGLNAQQVASASENARIRALGPLAQEYADLLVRLGTSGVPSLTNRSFVLSVALGGDGRPKERFRWLFPDTNHALVLVRPRANLTDGQIRALGRRVEALAGRAHMQGVHLDVAGVPLLVAEIADSFQRDLLRLAPVVALGLILALLLGFRRGRRRLRLLVLAAGGVLATAAASRLLGLGLTPATVAALPVVLGLAVDYGVQLQTRYWHERGAGHPPAAAAQRARRALAPVLGLAAAAMAVGFATLALSPIPLIDRLGWTLAAGVLLSVALVLALGPALLAWRDAGTPGVAPRLRAGGLERRLGAVGAARARALAPAAAAVLSGAAVAGLVLSHGTPVQSDLAALAPHDLPALKQIQATERSLGTGGVLRFAITGRDVLDPQVLVWQREAAQRALKAEPRLQPGPNVAELLADDGGTPAKADVDRLVSLLPRYFLDAVVTRDRHRGELSFGVPAAPVSEQARILSGVQAAMGTPPDGVHVAPAGLVARGVQSVDDLEAARPTMLLIALAIVAALLLAVRRNLRRALVPLVPTLLAAGVTALVVRAGGIVLSPLGAALEPLVLAVGVEFGLLLEARYAEARSAGLGPAQARALTVERVGAAVWVSALAAAVGFGALLASKMSLLSQFGALVAVEVLLCAGLAVWLVPALSALLDERPARRARNPERSAPGNRMEAIRS